MKKLFSLFLLLTVFSAPFSFADGGTIEDENSQVGTSYETHSSALATGILYYKKVHGESLIFLKTEGGVEYQILNIPEWKFFDQNIGSRVEIRGFWVRATDSNEILGIRATGPAQVTSPYNDIVAVGGPETVVLDSEINSGFISSGEIGRLSSAEIARNHSSQEIPRESAYSASSEVSVSRVLEQNVLSRSEAVLPPRLSKTGMENIFFLFLGFSTCVGLFISRKKLSALLSSKR